MPGHQKRRYNVRFPPARIKKIMQKDTEVGRIAAAVPVIISRALEMFLTSLLTKACQITQAKRSRVMSITHMKQCIESEKLFDFLKDLAEHTTPVATKREARGGKGKWPYRKKRQDISANAKQLEVEERPKKPNNDSRDNHDNHDSSSDGDSELYICL